MSGVGVQGAWQVACAEVPHRHGVGAAEAGGSVGSRDSAAAVGVGPPRVRPLRAAVPRR